MLHCSVDSLRQRLPDGGNHLQRVRHGRHRREIAQRSDVSPRVSSLDGHHRAWRAARYCRAFGSQNCAVHLQQG